MRSAYGRVIKQVVDELQTFCLLYRKMFFKRFCSEEKLHRLAAAPPEGCVYRHDRD
jgi:hypothetical protein